MVQGTRWYSPPRGYLGIVGTKYRKIQPTPGVPTIGMVKTEYIQAGTLDTGCRQVLFPLYIGTVGTGHRRSFQLSYVGKVGTGNI